MSTGNLSFISSSLRPFRNLIQTVSISTSFSSLHVGKRGVRAISDSKKEDPEVSSAGSTSVAGGVVALGKFDALHVGHRALAIQASKAGVPFLVSFVGIAEVLGWAPRVPIVAKCDRERVLSSWASYCGDVAPTELSIEFASVRHLTPRQFVEKLCKELGVSGIVAGENYRFGYKAVGTTSDLVNLCEEYGMKAYIVSSVMDKNQSPGIPSNTSQEKGQVSSTRVRHALAEGDMEYVSDLLGRNHRLVLSLPDEEDFGKSNRISARKSCLLNLPPRDGIYENCSLLVDNNIQVPCRTVIDSTHIHVEFDDGAPTQGYRSVHLEFGSPKIGI